MSLQENINWSFTEVAISPLPVIDVIDKNVSSVSALYHPCVYCITNKRANITCIRTHYSHAHTSTTHTLNCMYCNYSGED